MFIYTKNIFFRLFPLFLIITVLIWLKIEPLAVLYWFARLIWPIFSPFWIFIASFKENYPILYVMLPLFIVLLACVGTREDVIIWQQQQQEQHPARVEAGQKELLDRLEQVLIAQKEQTQQMQQAIQEAYQRQVDEMNQLRKSGE